MTHLSDTITTTTEMINITNNPKQGDVKCTKGCENRIFSNTINI